MAGRRTHAVTPGLSGAETRAAVRAWQADNDRRARERVVEAYLPIARRLAYKYASAQEPMDDLIQVASLALVKAVDRYDPDHRSPFLAFLVPTILGELKRYFRDTGWSAHVPRSRQELALRVDRAARELAGDTAGTPTAQQIADRLDITLEAALLGLEANRSHYAVGFDGANEESEPGAAPAPAEITGAIDDGYEMIEVKLTVKDAIDRLPFYERRAVELRMGEDLKQSEVAERMSCSQMNVSRLLRGAALRLHAAANP